MVIRKSHRSFFAAGWGIMWMLALGTNAFPGSLPRSSMMTTTMTTTMTMMSSSSSRGGKGKLLVLGGTGFLGQTVCKRASLEGYSVTSLSRRGLPSPDLDKVGNNIDYRTGDARQKESILNILNEGDYVGVIHLIGLLLDSESGLGDYNRLVSGSGSVPDDGATYDAITRLTAFNAIDATMEYISKQNSAEKKKNFPFVFMSAAEAGWPDVPGGAQVEQYLAPQWLRRYLQAKRAVEARLMSTECRPTLRPVIPRASLIYSLDKPASYIPVGAFFVGNKIGLPFVDRPVTVQSLANAIVRSISRDSVIGFQRYEQIDQLNK